jgi:hypothetical protein
LAADTMARFERALEALPYTVLLPLLEPREIGALARCSRAALAFGGAEAHWRWLVTRDFCSTVLQAPTSPVGTWRAVYAALDSLQRLRWRAFENAGGKKLHSWRTDRREVAREDVLKIRHGSESCQNVSFLQGSRLN